MIAFVGIIVLTKKTTLDRAEMTLTFEENIMSMARAIGIFGITDFL